MIYLHTDKKYRPDRWHQRFETVLASRGLDYRKVNLRKRDPLALRPTGVDGLIGRYAHHEAELARMKPIYQRLAERFGGRLFPQAHTYHYYDDKRRQAELLARYDYPTPRTAYVTSQSDVERFVDTTGLDFPLVTKAIGGAGSEHVRLARRPEEVILPGVVQEFCPGNDGDWRINVIGDRVMGFRRLNREGDFRASGSGKLRYTDSLPAECVELAWKISREQRFESMAYDFVRNGSGQWVVLEFSYTYVDSCVARCDFYYEMPSGRRLAKPGIWPQDFIVDDFLARHPELRQEPAKAWWQWGWRRSA